MDDTLFLLQTTYEKDKYGQDIPLNTEREVFCKVGSVSRSEFFNAGRNGLNPQFTFTVFKGEYQGQSYAIYRTYMTDDDYIELYVERKGGTNGEEGNG